MLASRLAVNNKWVLENEWQVWVQFTERVTVHCQIYGRPREGPAAIYT
jgi:hypothetical protein